MNIPDKWVRCPHCWTIPHVDAPFYGYGDRSCIICGATLRLFSACDIRERNPITWLHGKDDFLDLQKRYGFALVEYQTEPEYKFRISAERISSRDTPLYSQIVLTNEHLRPRDGS